MTIDVSYRWPDQFSHEETLMNSQTRSSLLTDQAPVDRRVDKATNWINLYPLDSTKRFGYTYLLNSVIHPLSNWAGILCPYPIPNEIYSELFEVLEEIIFVGHSGEQFKI